MTRKLSFDVNGQLEPFTIILTHKNHDVYNAINTATNIRFNDNIQPNTTFSFTVYKEVVGENGKITSCNVWDDIKDFRYIYIPELDEYYEIQVSLKDSNEVIKEVTATHASVSELSVPLYDIEINTEIDISRPEYKEPTIFYNSNNHSSSLLHRIFEKAPNYQIVHVDSTLKNIQRTFSISDVTIYDFCTSTLSEEIGCLFVFDSKNRYVYVYDLWNTCKECGYRGEFIDTCTKCGSHSFIEGYGDDTTIFVSKENLAEDIILETNSEDVVNCFKIEAGDDLMTAYVSNCNPGGGLYIYNFTEDTMEDMSDALSDKLKSYKKLSESLQGSYTSIMSDIYDTIDEELKLTSEMMPDIVIPETDAKKQLALLTASNLSPIAVTDVKKISLATANSAVLGMAKVVCSTNFKVEIESSSLSAQTWKGIFKITNRTNEEDTAISNSNVIIEITENYEKYIAQKIEKMLNKDNPNGVMDLLSIKDLSLFKTELKKYCLNRLESFESAFQSCIEILIEQGCGDKKTYPDLYEHIYLPHYNKLSAIQSEIKVRKNEIKLVQSKYSSLEKQRKEIQDRLDFNKFLGTDLANEFCSYRREQKYTNNNYISDGLSNTEILKKAQELIVLAKEELIKSSERKYSISATLGNLIKIKEFRPLLDSFKCGNYIRVMVDGELFKLRLLSYELTFEESNTTIAVEFSDVSKSNDLGTEMESILNQAASVNASFPYVEREASKAKISNTFINDMRKQGLQASNVAVVNADTEDVVFGKNGILLRSFDDITGDYGNEQVRIIHNSFNFTDDNWLTSKCALGKHFIDGVSYFGLMADFINAGKIWGTEIVGGSIDITNGTNSILIDSNNKNIFKLSKGDKDLLYIDTDGDLHMSGKINWDMSNKPEVDMGDIVGLDTTINDVNKSLSDLNDSFIQLDERIQTFSQDDDPSINWNSQEKEYHINDIWFDTKNELTKKWNGSSWIIISDSILTELAKSKAQIFSSTPVPPYYVGDLWTQGVNGDIYVCQVTRVFGNFIQSDWKKASKYTDDSTILDFINNEYADDIKDIQTQTDKKAETWYQSNDPSANWTTTALKALHKGDIWFNSTASVQRSYIWNGTKWEETKTSPPQDIFDKFDGKASLFVSKPSSYNKNDLWILEVENANGASTSYPKYKKGSLLTATATRTSYVNSDWVEKVYYTESINEAKTSIAKNEEAIKLAATKTEVTQTLAGYYTKTQADAAIKISSDEVSTNVSKTLNNYYTKSQSDAAIKANSDSITSTVSKTYATKSEVDGIAIGGRNLAKKSAISFYSVTGKNSGYEYTFKNNPDTRNAGLRILSSLFKIDEYYVLSFKIRINSGTINNIAGHSVGFATKKMFVTNASSYSDVWSSGATVNWGVGTYKVEVYLKYNGSSATDNNLYIQPNRNGTTSTYDVTIYDIKVEIGNKVTDWTPAVEDIEEEFSSTSTKISQLDTKITTTASATDSLGTRMTKMEQDSKGFTWTIDETAIVSSVNEFYKSTSSTSLSGGSWSTAQPTWEQGKYIWTRSKNTNGKGTVSYSPSTTGVCITGNTGDKGATGAKGDTGAAGKGIKSTAVTYQASTSGTTVPTGTWGTSIPSVSAGSFLWTRTITTYTDNATSTSYSVGKMGNTGATGAKGDKGDKGDKGATGSTGAQGPAGKDANAIAHTFGGTSGTAGYVAFATVTVTAQYANAPCSFRLANRGQEMSDIQFAFANANSTDPGLAYLRGDGGIDVWMQKTATSTWRLIAQKADSYDGFTLFNFNKPANANGYSITWTNTHLTSLPSSTSANPVVAKAGLSASKTATNYMKFDTNGLCVGDMTAGTLTNNVLINNNSVNIRNGSTVLATYGSSSIILGQTTTNNLLVNTSGVNIRNGSTVLATFTNSTIELGKNSTSSVIKLCGNSGTITSKSQSFNGGSYSSLVIESNYISLNSPNAIQLNTNNYKSYITVENHIMLSASSTSNIYIDPSEVQIFAKDRILMTGIKEVSIATNPGGEIWLSNATVKGSRSVKKLYSSGGLYMNSSQTAKLSEPISEQLNGIVIEWARYQNSAATSSRSFTFIPKSITKGHYIDVFLVTGGGEAAGSKSICINDTSIVGNSNNDKAAYTGSNNIKLTPTQWVLVAVHGI